MNRHLTRTLLATAAAVFAIGTAQAADDSQMTRAQVRAELADARAAGLLDQPGEAGATEAVLEARENYNALQTLVLQARAELEAQALAANEIAEPDLDVYYEAGPQGPVMVLLTYDAEGDLYSADSVMLAQVEVDLD